MANDKKYKGITLKFGADTKTLDTALNSVENKIKDIDREMKAVNESLKLNPNSSIAKNQQFELLSKSIEATAEKLKELKSVQEEVEKEFADGNIGEEAYRSFQRELENTRARLNQLQNEQIGLTQTTDNLDEATNSAENLSNELENARKEGIKKFSDSVGTLKTEVKDTVNDIVELGTKAIAAIATATTAALAGATKVGMDFEAAMSQVVATMGIDKTTEEFYKLEDIAKEMGATTKYTATEAAEALNYLGLSIVLCKFFY